MEGRLVAGGAAVARGRAGVAAGRATSVLAPACSESASRRRGTRGVYERAGASCRDRRRGGT